MKITTEFIRSLQNQIREERERKAAELENLRREYADTFLDQHIPNLNHIQSLLMAAIEKNPDATEYKLHILTMGMEEASTLHPTMQQTNTYMRIAYHKRFGGWFHQHIPAAYLECTPLGNDRYLEVYLVFTLRD